MESGGNMTAAEIHQTAAHFNERSDYDIRAALDLSAVLIRHAHLVQIARTQAADPQLMLPIQEATQ
jgi:hypothetical protein